jgi:hypothetical protein
VITGDGRTIHAYLALVSPTHPDALRGNILDADEGKTFDFDLLKDDVFPFGHLDRHKLISLIAFLYCARILFLADFARKFLKVIIGQSLYLILLHLGLVPSLQTVEVDHCT